MAKEENSSNKGKKDKQEKSVETDVILIVKGAGEQVEDEHLNIFLRGFWPAIKSLDPDATIDQVTDEMKEKEYEPPPHNQEKDKHRHLTEIHAKYISPDNKGEKQERRIWVKESYWEDEVLPSNALSNLSKEWRMASFAFASVLQDLVFKRNTKKLKKDRLDGNIKSVYPEPEIRDYLGNYLSYLLLFVLAFLPLVTTSTKGASRIEDILVSSLSLLMTGASGIADIVLGFGFSLAVIAVIWALAPALEISRMTHARYYKKVALKRLPGLPGWMLFLLILLLIIDPLGYITFLLILLALQICFLISRRLLWKYRKYGNSDVDKAEYYSFKYEKEKYIGKVDESFLPGVFFSPLIYRYFIFLALPIGFVISYLVTFLKWTRIFGGVGETLDAFVKFLLVGYMDDVVNYAMDPAQAHRVRSAVKNDIIYFCEKYPEVKRIHVVAHSQGTPITYETLFHYLEPKYQNKIITYLTIGSVLSYYLQARGTLDPIYYRRFPISPTKKLNFPDNFKWMNFWNFTDPITEFYGLDEYSDFDKAPPLDKVEKPERACTCPTNIRTRSSLLKNHGEYWSNLEQINIPFAKRVLGELRPPEWGPNFTSTNWHHWGVLLLTVFVALALFWLLVPSGILNLLTNYLSDLYENGSKIIMALFPAPEEPGLFQRFNSLVVDESADNPLRIFWESIVNGSLLALAVVATLDWINQMRRAFKIGR